MNDHDNNICVHGECTWTKKCRLICKLFSRSGLPYSNSVFNNLNGLIYIYDYYKSPSQESHCKIHGRGTGEQRVSCY